MSATLGRVTWSMPSICWDDSDFADVVAAEVIPPERCNPREIQLAIGMLRGGDPVGLRRSNVGGWHSPDITPTQTDSFLPLLTSLRKPLGRYVERFGRLELHMVNMWAVVSPPGASNDWHDHASNFISGVYYVQVDHASSCLQFRSKSGRIHEVMPKPGMVVLFPSWMEHSVGPNRSMSERVVVSFNLLYQPPQRDGN